MKVIDVTRTATMKINICFKNHINTLDILENGQFCSLLTKSWLESSIKFLSLMSPRQLWTNISQLFRQASLFHLIFCFVLIIRFIDEYCDKLTDQSHSRQNLARSCIKQGKKRTITNNNP